MNLRELEAAVTDNFALTAPAITITRILNDVYTDLSRPFTADMQQTTTFEAEPGNCTYIVPVPARKLFSVLWNDVPLRQVVLQALIIPKPTGTPRRWAPNGLHQDEGVAARNRLRFELDVKPDAAGEIGIRYEPAPAPLFAPEDAPQFIPDDHHHLIVWGARHFLAAENGAWNDAQYWGDRFVTGAAEMLTSLGLTAPETYPTIRQQVEATAQRQRGR